jgi:hypothetical protein
LAATPRQILSALGKRSHAKVADVRAKFEERGIVTGVTYSRAVVPEGTRLYAFLLAQARQEWRRLHPNASLDEQRALVVGVHADVLEAARFNDLASARAASSDAAYFEALRKHDADLVSRARENPGAAHFSKFNAQCRALQEQLDAAGFGVQGWDTSTTPEHAGFFRYQAARARQVARERLGQNVSALRVAFAKIRTIFREAADFTDVAYVDTCDAAAFDALAAADADLEGRARARGGGRGGGRVAAFPKKRGGRVAAFPKKLAEIVRRHAGVVFWDETARELVIVDQARLVREVLPLYFNMKGFHGFRVQLENYGFSKVNQSANYGSRPKVSVIYSNTAVADLTKLKRQSGGAAAPAPEPSADAPNEPPRAEDMATPHDGALALMLAALYKESRQAAAAPAPVVASPALVSPVAAGASPKRPRAPSPKSVAPPCVEATNEQETLKLFNTGRCFGRRDAGGEAGAVRRRRSFAGGLVGQVLRGGRPGGARVGLLAENRRGGARRHRCTAAERRRRRARGSWVVARAAGGHPRGPRGIPVGSFPGALLELGSGRCGRGRARDVWARKPARRAGSVAEV